MIKEQKKSNNLLEQIYLFQGGTKKKLQKIKESPEDWKCKKTNMGYKTICDHCSEIREGFVEVE